MGDQKGQQQALQLMQKEIWIDVDRAKLLQKKSVRGREFLGKLTRREV